MAKKDKICPKCKKPRPCKHDKVKPTGDDGDFTEDYTNWLGIPKQRKRKEKDD